MASKKTYRISKAAKNLNVGHSTIVEFLEKKGFEVENKPTAKITQEMYDILLSAFASDIEAKEESKSIEILKDRKNKGISVDDIIKQKEEYADEEDLIDDNKDTFLIKDTGLYAKPKENDSIDKPKEDDKKEDDNNTEPKTFEKHLKGPKILGKIDLDKKSSKKPEPPKEDKEISNEKEEENISNENLVETSELNKTIEADDDINNEKTTLDSKEEINIESELNEQNTNNEDKTLVESKETITDNKTTSETTDNESEINNDETTTKDQETNLISKDENNIETTDSGKEKENDENIEEEIVTPEYQKLQGISVVKKIDLSNFEEREKRKREKEKEREKEREKEKKEAKEKQKELKEKRKKEIEERKEKRKRIRKNTQKVDISAHKPSTPKTSSQQDKEKANDKKSRQHQNLQHNRSLKNKIKRDKKRKIKNRRVEEEKREEEKSKIIEVTEFISANEVASMMDVPVTDVISACFSLGMMVSINQRLDAETINIVAEEFGFDVKFVNVDESIDFEEEEDDAPEDLKPRAPIVTVMGHVDHGKTSLLDYIRNANVIAGEAGGITQHVAAYEVSLPDKRKITFIDTPGHEAFTAMRARGASVTDIAIIVISADDTVMPQTEEAISHAQAAGVPIVFAINKIDKPDANPDRIKEALSQKGFLIEEWGGKYQSQEISAKKGINIDELLEKVLLEAELLELTANSNKNAKGAIMEARLEKGRGNVATVLVQDGTLKIGDTLVAGSHYAKVRAMFNERGITIKKAGPSSPVTVLGFQESPDAGEIFRVTDTESEAKEIATKRAQLIREQSIRANKHITLDEIGRRLSVGSFKELNLIVKGDVSGSVQALSDSLSKLSTEEIQVKIIHSGVGAISESDVLLASASDAIIVGFQVRPSSNAKKIAETEKIEIRTYSVIYRAIEEVKSAMEGLLAPELKEEVIGNVEVRETFKISKVGTIAGAFVTDGKVTRDAKIRIIREGVVIYEGEIQALKRFKDDAKEVTKGYECGIQIKNYNDLKELDIFEVFTEVEVKRKLE